MSTVRPTFYSKNIWKIVKVFLKIYARKHYSNFKSHQLSCFKIHFKTNLKPTINVYYGVNHRQSINTIMYSKGASPCGHRLVAAVEARLVASFVHRAPGARPCGPGQDAGHDGDQQRCGGGMLSPCPPRYPHARFSSVSQHPKENMPKIIV